MEKVQHHNLATELAATPLAENTQPTLRFRRETIRALKPVQPETIGNYLLVKTIGRGSMGEVFLAQHLDDPSRQVALKVFRPNAAHAAALQSRFRNEITMSARVHHPNVVHPLEIVQRGDQLAYTMEYMDRGDLAEWMRQNPHPPVEEIIKTLVQVCEGVQAIHEAGMIHRDIKPENILLNKDGDIRISDFALARTKSLTRATQRGKIVGTIDYLSPQYLEHGAISAQCDVYAIGALAFELLARRAPFVGDGVYESIMMKISNDAPLVTEVNPSVPHNIAVVIAKALARSTEQRFKTPAEFAEALKSASAGNFSVETPLIPWELSGDTVLIDRPSVAPQQVRHLTLIPGGRSTQVEGHVVTFSPVRLSQMSASSAILQRRGYTRWLPVAFFDQVATSTVLVLTLVGVTATLLIMASRYL